MVGAALQHVEPSAIRVCIIALTQRILREQTTTLQALSLMVESRTHLQNRAHLTDNIARQLLLTTLPNPKIILPFGCR